MLVDNYITRQPRPELINVINIISKEKDIPLDEVFDSIKEVVIKMALSQYGSYNTIDVDINKTNGAIAVFKVLKVVEEVSNIYKEISLEDALKVKQDAKIDDEIKEELPPVDFSRVSAQISRHMLSQKILGAEKEKEFNAFIEKKGTIVSGLVKHIDNFGAVIDLGKAEGYVAKSSFIPNERLEVGNRYRFLISDVRRSDRRIQILLTRTTNEFLLKLFMQEVPELYDGLVEIKAIARDPGSRAKVAVYTRESNLDPVGAVVGFKGSKVNSIVAEIAGEKIDVVLWDENLANFAINAFNKISLSKVIVDEEVGVVTVVVEPDSLSLAIGRAGQNVRLLSRLLGAKIELLTPEQEAEKSQEETSKKVNFFKEALDIDEVASYLLVFEGFSTVKDILNASIDRLVSIEGFDEEIAQELQERSKEFLEQQEKEQQEKLKRLGLDDSLISFEGLIYRELKQLAENEIFTLQDLSDLSSYELIDCLAGGIDKDRADFIILKARQISN